MSDHRSYGFPPAGVFGVYVLIRAIWKALTEAERVTPPPTQVKTLPPPWVPAPPVVRWTSDRELLAWRAWRLARWGPDRRLRLLSMSANWAWDGPVFTSDFLPYGADANHSGVYALAGRPFSQIEWVWSEHCWVLGWVALSGRVIEHRYGYRAERAVIRRLRLGVGTHLKVDEFTLMMVRMELEERYQAPVKVGHLERRIARRLLSQQPLLEQGGIGYARPEKGMASGIRRRSGKAAVRRSRNKRGGRAVEKG